MTNRQKEPVVLYFCIFILFVTSMGLWIGWIGRSKYIFSFVGIVALFFCSKNNIPIVWNRKNVIPLVIYLVANIYIWGEVHVLGPFFYLILPSCLLFLLDDEHKIKCLIFIYKWYAYLILISLITYVLYWTVGLPSLGTLLMDEATYYDNSYVLRENYIFYNYTDFYKIRFCGPFKEPGHVGTMSSFLLLATGFNLKKKETWMLLAGIISSLSLSGYMLTLIAFVLTKYEQGRFKIKSILFFAAFLVFIMLFAFLYKNGDNLLMEYIMSRLEYDEDKGFSGNNRIYGGIDIYFAGLFTDNNLLLFGYDKNTIEALTEHGARGTGLFYWMICHGIVGTFIAFSTYISYFWIVKNKKIAIVFLLFVIFVFWQRSYPFWFAWIICYFYGANYHKVLLLNKGGCQK